MNGLKSLDQQLLKWAYLSSFGKHLPLKPLIFMGDGPFWLIILGLSSLLGVLFNYTEFLKLSILFILGFTIAQIVFLPFKIFVKRRRPYANKALQAELGIKIENRDPGHGSKEMESFPSGHLYWTTMSVCFISFQFGLPGILLFGWMIPAMLYLRLYLGVHYPSDVIAGSLFGFFTALATLWILPYAYEVHKYLEQYSWYPWVYLGFIVIFIFGGYRSWLKRV